jgi:hypothetical protein
MKRGLPINPETFECVKVGPGSSDVRDGIEGLRWSKESMIDETDQDLKYLNALVVDNAELERLEALLDQFNSFVGSFIKLER